MLNEHIISISYSRVLDICVQLGVEGGVVCVPVLQKGLFTTYAMDNIDRNHTATELIGTNLEKGNVRL